MFSAMGAVIGGVWGFHPTLIQSAGIAVCYLIFHLWCQGSGFATLIILAVAVPFTILFGVWPLVPLVVLIAIAPWYFISRKRLRDYAISQLPLAHLRQPGD